MHIHEVKLERPINPTCHVFGLWEETGKNPKMDMQTPDKTNPRGQDSNPGPSCIEVEMFPTAPPGSV